MPKFKVTEDFQNWRADAFVSQQLTEVSRAFIGKLADEQKILVNGQPVKASQKVKTGDKVELDYKFKQADPKKLKLEVLYEDEDVLVLNKPVGVLTHSKGAYNPEATVASFIKPKLSQPDNERAGIVHRLDRATSGVMITAKTPEAQKWLQKQFANRRVKKTYVAVVEGVPEPPAAIIDMPIERHPKRPQTFRTGQSGKSAVTEYKVLQSGHGRSLVELKPLTGRTHQLRVHLKQLGHPIVGDSLYGGPEADRLYLHAASLELTLPNRQRQVFSVRVPDGFKIES